MSLTQKMFACSGFMLIVVLAVFARAIPVPVPDVAQPAEYRQFVPAQVTESVDEPAVLSVHRDVQVDPAVVRPIRSASPFFGILTGYEKPYKSQKQHHNYHKEEHEYEQEYHHRPEYQQEYNHRPEYQQEYHHKPEYQHRPQYHKPQHHHQQRPQQHGSSGAGSYASAGSFSGGNGGGNGHSQSGAHSQSASFGFGPFQASYSASSAQSGSHSDGGFSDY